MALDDGLVGAHTAGHIVGLDGQDLLQRVARAVGLERPDFHFAEALAAELRLAAERLLRDKGVRAGGTGMDLIVDQMVQLEEVNVADRDLVVKALAGAAVVQPALALGIEAGKLKRFGNILIGRAVEDGRGDLPAERLGGVAEMDLEHLADVHTGRNAEGVQNDVERGAVGQEGHILLRQNAGDDALVAVAACHLVAGLDLAALRDVNAHDHVHAGAEVVAVLAGEHLGVDHDAALAVRHLEGGIAHLARLLAEDRAQQALLRGQIGLALGRDLADQNIAGVNLRADADDTALVEVLESVLADVGNVARDLLGAELGVAGVELILLEVDGGIQVLADKALVEEHRVLVVVALPRHEADEDVASERQLALIGGRAVRQHGGVDGLAVFIDILAVHALADVDDRVLVDAGSVVGAQELGELVFLRLAVVVSHGDGAGVHLGHDAVALGEDGDLGVHADLVLHTGTDDGSLGSEQRNGLTLHIRAHQGTVRVVVRQERDHRGRDGDHHARGNVDVVNAVAVDLDDLVAVAAGDTRVDKAAVLIDRLGRLTDDELILNVGGHVGDLVGDMARRVIDSAEGRLDEAVFVDAGVGREVGDQADVRTFGGLDGAHTAVVAVVDVADLHVRALTAKAAGAERGKTALVRQLGERVRLIHELGQRAGAEELLDGRGDRTDVDEALRRHDVEILNGHALADHTLHAGKADAELVLQQLAHAAQAAVAEMVDIVLRDDAVRQRVHVVDGGENIVRKDVLGRETVGVVADGFLELLALVLRQQLLEHALAHALLDTALGDGVEVHEAGEVDHVVREDAQRLAVEVERHVVDADGVKLAGLVAGHDMAGVEEDLARARVGDGIGELLAVDAGPQGELLIELVAADHGQIIAARIEEEVLDQALAGLDRGWLARTELAVDLQHGLLIGLAGVLLQRDLDAVVVAEEVEDSGVGLEVGVLLSLTADGADQLGDGDLAVLVDADPEHLVGVGLILQPRAAVGDHGAGE